VNYSVLFLLLNRKSRFFIIGHLAYLFNLVSPRSSTHAYDFEGFSRRGHASLVLMLSYSKGLFIQNQKLPRDDQTIIFMFLKMC
jgi:hypothetical protein